MNMTLIPIEIRKVKHPDGSFKLTAGVTMAFASNKAVMAKVNKLEQNFVALQTTLQRKTKNVKTNSIVHWEIADEVYRFFDEAEKDGFLLQFHTVTLADFVGQKHDYWQSHAKFRRLYPTKDLINKNISWTLYVALTRVDDAELRKKLEALAAEGKIKNPSEIRRYKNGQTKSVLTKAQQKVLTLLTEKPLTRHELIGSVGQGYAARISELKDVHHYHIEVINGKYTLKEKTA